MRNCKSIARLHGTDEISEASLATRIGVRLHLIMCRNCRRYASQLRALGRAARFARKHDQRDTNALRRLEDSILDPDRRS